MSYSFNLRAPSKAAALAAVTAKMDEVAAQQACHQRDKAQAVAAAESFLALLPDDDTRDVAVNMSGYLAGTWQGSDVVNISSANMVVAVAMVPRAA
jgi:3-hydroxyisobutyrate dehydrogenase-like beta-hydroxyacid dehydrogenase